MPWWACPLCTCCMVPLAASTCTVPRWQQARSRCLGRLASKHGASVCLPMVPIAWKEVRKCTAPTSPWCAHERAAPSMVRALAAARWPWLLPRSCCLQHERRLANVRGHTWAVHWCYTSMVPAHAANMGPWLLNGGPASQHAHAAYSTKGG